MWINTSAFFEALLGAAITFILHAALLFAIGGVLSLLWTCCKWIYRKIAQKSNNGNT